MDLECLVNLNDARLQQFHYLIGDGRILQVSEI